MMSVPRRPARAGFGAARSMAATATSTAILRNTKRGALEGAPARIENFICLSFRMLRFVTLCANDAGSFSQAVTERRALCAHGRDVAGVAKSVEIGLHVRQGASCTGSGHQPRHFQV